MLQLIFSNTLLVLLLLFWTPPLLSWSEMSIDARLASLILLIFAAAFVYLLALFVSGIRPSMLRR